MVSAKRSRSIDLRVWRSGSCLNSCSMLRAMKCARAKVLPGLLMSTVRKSEEHTSELQSLMRISYAVFCLKKKNNSTLTTCTYIAIILYAVKDQHTTNSTTHNTISTQ